MESVEFAKRITELTKHMTDSERSLARSTLQTILIGELSVSPMRLDMAMDEFKKCLQEGLE